MKSSGDISIPYWVYFIVGGVVIIVSYIVNKQTEDSPMTIFIVVGVGFLLAGFAKWVYSSVMGKRKKFMEKVKHMHVTPA